MSKGVNKVILVGHVGDAPDIRSTEKTVVTSFSVATSISYKKDGAPVTETEWHKVVAYGRLAEICGEYVHKGSKVYIEGRLKTRKWQDKQGIERYTTEIIASDMQLLDKKEGQLAPAADLDF